MPELDLTKAIEAATESLVKSADHWDGWLSDFQGHEPYGNKGESEVFFSNLDGSLDISHAVSDAIQAALPHLLPDREELGMVIAEFWADSDTPDDAAQAVIAHLKERWNA